MEIHELNTFSGTPGASDYFATDNGSDTSKISAESLFAPLAARIDNIITSPAPSAEEVTDARLGADGVTYTSLGLANRTQFVNLKNAFESSDNVRKSILSFLDLGNYTSSGNDTNGYHPSANTQTYGMSAYVYAEKPIVFIKKPEAVEAGLTCAVQIFRKEGDIYKENVSRVSWFNATQYGGTSIEAGVYYWIGFRDGNNPHQLTKAILEEYFEVFEVYNNIGFGQSHTDKRGFWVTDNASIDINIAYAEENIRVISSDWANMRVTYGIYPSDEKFTPATSWQYSKRADFTIPKGTYYRLAIFKQDDTGTTIKISDYKELLEMRSAVSVVEGGASAKYNPAYSNDQIDARGLATLVANIAKRLDVVEKANDINVIPTYYESHIASKVSDINDLRPDEGGQFAFITDIHISGYTSKGGNQLNSHSLLNYLCQNTMINKVFNGGDLLNNNLNYTIPASIQKIRTAIGYAQPDTTANQFYIVGNHDGGYDYDGNGDVTAPRHVTPDMLAVASGVYSVAMDVIYDDNSPFQYYYDNEKDGMRYIVLDIGERDTATDEAYLDSWRFFVDALLSTPTNYHIVVFNHRSGYTRETGTISETYKQYIYDTVDAYNARETYALTESESCNFTNANGIVACVVCGHSHEDYNGTTTGGVPWFVTTTDNAGGQFTNGVNTGRSTGTTDEQAFDVFTINKDTRTINVTRIGFGANRSATY